MHSRAPEAVPRASRTAAPPGGISHQLQWYRISGDEQGMTSR
jgi:hypothetical protein